MKIRYRFADNETTEIEISDEWGENILELDRQEFNINRKETRRHTAMDSYEFLDDQAGTNPRLSRDAFEYRNRICVDSAETAADLERKYTRQHIRDAVSKLKPAQRDLITAIYFNGVSVNEYAKREGVDHSAISHRLQTAYKHLKKLL
ncbi:MAG: sigma factor-like helix-turn-helix DNA-binding protein [Oscillospiraceae bacterium]|nr:sigma factor-like helix-turn-helix DNA-binding protein [Oscillospiraceae bacterium]